VKTLGKFIVVGYCGRKYEEPHWTGSFPAVAKQL